MMGSHRFDGIPDWPACSERLRFDDEYDSDRLLSLGRCVLCRNFLVGGERHGRRVDIASMPDLIRKRSREFLARSGAEPLAIDAPNEFGWIIAVSVRFASDSALASINLRSSETT